jgi:CRP-like cAMP-binding protein
MAFVQDLSRIQLFDGLPTDLVATVAGQCRWNRLADGEQVFDKDSESLDVYFVQSGGVRILTTGPDGREVALADIPVGQYFGELAAIDGKPRSARHPARTGIPRTAARVSRSRVSRARTPRADRPQPRQPGH